MRQAATILDNTGRKQVEPRKVKLVFPGLPVSYLYD